ncbi:MAG: hypothetical protein ABFS46_07020 [Myxococcota bacterium]
MRQITGALALVLSFTFAPFSAEADAGTDHQQEQLRPLPLGTSGGNELDASRTFCCGGTLGALVRDADGIDYVLSNNHVLARTNAASPGEGVIQPGLIDVLCRPDPGLRVAALSRFVPILFNGTANRVDAAIAATVSGAVDSSGAILDIGIPAPEIVPPALGMAVQKSGRTTGHTFGTIEALNVTVDVAYGKRCGQGRQIARFVDQILVTPGSFSAGGDSGSLVIEAAATSPRAVGLLFAGGDAHTLLNPIADVLASLCIGMPGAASYPDPSACAVADGGGDGGDSGGGGPPPGRGWNRGDAVRGLERAASVQAAHQDRLLALDGVVGVGISVDRDTAVLEVYVEALSAGLERRLPGTLDGIAIRPVVTGSFEAF